jgi:hypothetical protein
MLGAYINSITNNLVHTVSHQPLWASILQLGHQEAVFWGYQKKDHTLCPPHDIRLGPQQRRDRHCQFHNIGTAQDLTKPNKKAICLQSMLTDSVKSESVWFIKLTNLLVTFFKYIHLSIKDGNTLCTDRQTLHCVNITGHSLLYTQAATNICVVPY